MIVEIAQADFVSWKNDRVTQFIFSHLEDVRAEILETMTSKDILGKQEGLLKLNHLRGYIDAIEDFINLDPVSDEELPEGLSE